MCTYPRTITIKRFPPVRRPFISYIHIRTCTYIHTYIHTYRQTDRQTGRQTGRQADRQRQTHTGNCFQFTGIVNVASFKSVDRSYAAFKPSSFLSETSSNVTTINVTLRPEDSDGLIASWESDSTDYFLLLLRNRSVELHYHLGKELTVVPSDYQLSLYGWHNIRIERRLKKGMYHHYACMYVCMYVCVCVCVCVCVRTYVRTQSNL